MPGPSTLVVISDQLLFQRRITMHYNAVRHSVIEREESEAAIAMPYNVVRHSAEREVRQ